MHYQRTLQLPNNQSFFLFGARNTGKSTLIHQRFPESHTLYLDLLVKENESRFTKQPDELYFIVNALPKQITHVFIDEIQKIPALLDVVHRLMTTADKLFILSSSSARKLKQSGVNRLAGRAFVYHLFPLTHVELGQHFQLQHILQWGSLLQCLNTADNQQRAEFLYAYSHTYLKEEIWLEQ